MSNLENTINNKAIFIRYQHGVAYYAVQVPYSDDLYSFPVPIENENDAILFAQKNALYFSDQIRDAIQNGTLLKEAA